MHRRGRPCVVPVDPADAVRALAGVGDAPVWPALAWSAVLPVALATADGAVYRRMR